MPEKNPEAATKRDPDQVGNDVARAVESQRQEATASQRSIGRNSRGEPEMYPSDIMALQTQYGLTAPEAEELWKRTVQGDEDADSTAESLIRGRVVYRARYEQVLNPADHALTAVQIAAAKEEDNRRRLEEAALANQGAITTPTADRTQPEAGPYGPYAEYEHTTLPVEEVAHNTQLKPEQVKEAGLAPGQQKAPEAKASK